MSRKYANLETQRLHDRTHGAAKAPVAPKMGEDMEHDMMAGDESPEEVVASHGPAKAVHIEGKHVRSEHGDGHVHESDHESVSAAHDHAKKLSGEAEGEEDGLGEMDHGGHAKALGIGTMQE